MCTSIQSNYVRKSSPFGISKFDNSIKSVVKAGGCPPSDFKIQDKAMVIKAMWYLLKDEQKTEIDQHIYN